MQYLPQPFNVIDPRRVNQPVNHPDLWFQPSQRFTLLVIEYIREKFVWASKKPIPVSIDAEHDKRIAENYVFDEVQGIYVLHAEHERRTKFNSNDYKPIKEEIIRFPGRPGQEQPETDNSMIFISIISSKQIRKGPFPTLRPLGYRGRERSVNRTLFVQQT